MNLFNQPKAFQIIELFLLQPSRIFSQKEVINRTEVSKATAVKWLSQLVKKNYVLLERVGPTNQYWLNDKHPSIKHIKILQTITSLEDLQIDDCKIYLYGSAARGEDDEHSDIDLLIIGKTEKAKVSKIIREFSEKVGKEINYNLYTRNQWRNIRQKDQIYYEEVQRDKILLTYK